MIFISCCIEFTRVYELRNEVVASNMMGSTKEGIVGGLLRLFTQGSQDRVFATPWSGPGSRSSRYLDSDVYGHDYSTLQLAPGGEPGVLTLVKQADAIGDVDLVIDDPQGRSLNELVEKVQVTIGGQVIDCWTCKDDIETLIKTCCALFGCSPSRVRTRTVIPLVLAPFNRRNVFPLVALKHRDVNVNVTLRDPAVRMELWGNRYFLDNVPRERLKTTPQEFMVWQTQAHTRPTTKNGEVYTCLLNFNHPCLLLFFWGVDKERVSRVRLYAHYTTDAVYYDGPIEQLEYFQASRWNMQVDARNPTCIFFGDTDMFSSPKASMNMSRIDYAYLELTTSQDIRGSLKISAIGSQPLRISCGEAGLAFSK